MATRLPWRSKCMEYNKMIEATNGGLMTPKERC